MSEHLPPCDAPPVSGSGGVRLLDQVEERARPLSRKARGALPLATVGAGMLVRRVSVRSPDVVFVKGVVEASDGLAAVFAEQGGELLFAAPREREAELGELLADLEVDLGARVRAPVLMGETPMPPAHPVMMGETPMPPAPPAPRREP